MTQLASVFSGNTIVLKHTITAAAGGAQNLTGCTLIATLKASASDSDANAISLIKSSTGGIVIDSPATLGTATSTFPASATAAFSTSKMLVFQLKLVDGTGAITTIEEGTISVKLSAITTNS